MNTEDQHKAAVTSALHYGHHAAAFSIAYLATLTGIMAYTKLALGPISIYYNALAQVYSVTPFIVTLCLLSVPLARKFTERHSILTLALMFVIGASSAVIGITARQGFDWLKYMTLPRLMQEGMVIGCGIAGLLLALIYILVLKIMRHRLQ